MGLLEEYGVSQVPVVKAEPPLALAEVVGSVSDRQLLEHALHDPESFDRAVSSVMGPPMATVGHSEPVEGIATRLESDNALLVLDGGHPIGILTRSDLLAFLGGH
jgi:cystathionine beta-synthase